MRFLLSNPGVTLTNYYAATHPSQPNYVIQSWLLEKIAKHNNFFLKIACSILRWP